MILFFQEPPEVEVGKPAPDVAFARSDGSQLRLSKFRGKVVVVEFSSFNCPPCRAIAPQLEKFAEAYRKKNVVCLVVSTDPPEKLAKIAALRKIADSSIVLQDVYSPDRSKMAVWQFGNVAVPTLFVIDGAGKFASRRIDDGISHLKLRVEWALKKTSIQSALKKG